MKPEKIRLLSSSTLKGSAPRLDCPVTDRDDAQAVFVQLVTQRA